MASKMSTRYLALFLSGFIATSLVNVKAQDKEKQQSDSAQPSATFHEELIAEMTPESEFKRALVGDTHLVWVESRAGALTVRLDGKQQGQAYKDVKDLTFNNDESHFAFFAQRPSSSWAFVLDGQEQLPEYVEISAIAFQPKGSSYAFCACREKKKCTLVVDGAQTGAAYEEVSYPRYSRDGKRLGFLGKRDKKWIAILDGKESGPELDDFWHSSWGFTRNGSHFVVAGRIKNDWIYVIDGQPTPAFGVLSPIGFTSDGQHYAYAGTVAKAGTWSPKQKTTGTVIRDGQSVATFQGRGLWGASAKIATGVREFSSDFHGVSTPQFNPEGKLVYAARRDKGDVAVFVGSDAGPGFDEILSSVAFSEDSQHFAYVAKRGGDFVEVRDNVPGQSSTSSRHKASGVHWIAMNGDATHLAYETVSGGTQYEAGATSRALRTVILDGQPGPEYDALNIRNFRFTGNAKHYYYEVIGAKGDRDLVNVDGHESQLYDGVIDTRFASGGKLVTFIARDGRRFLRVSSNLD